MSSQATPTVPRLSSSVIVINHLSEILFVHRNPKAGAFAGMHVFPGGNYDSKQDDSLAMTAIRETFEETGLLLASSRADSAPADDELNARREKVHSQKRLFSEFLTEYNLTPDVSALMRFTQWTTPTNMPRRFQTQFFVTFLDAPASGFTDGNKLDRLPTPDGGQEVIAARFIHPAAALREYESKQISLMPPQFYLLTTLAPLLTGNANAERQRARVETLARSAFGSLSIHPVSLKQGAPDGWMHMVYEGDELHGGQKGCLHRSVVKVGKGGSISEIILQRSFDVFGDLPRGCVTENLSKL
ncbi:hypothetical protein BDW22DRAFT_1364363 [Trametopsis cervina]|nr:hypothetical protein BDW22DRAFT_1364363 [Trametopsis cervina]